MRRPRAYTLTADLVAAHAGAPAVCLDAAALGRSYRLHAARPGASLNHRLTTDSIEPGEPTAPLEIEPVPSVIQVEIRGPIEQRAGYHDMCGGWSDGYDAITERMNEALEIGDVLLVLDSPGGAAMGIVECVRRISEKKVHAGRRITGSVLLAGSAAFWIAACVCDEIFLQPQGVAGSIGARNAWHGCSAALANEGIDVEQFAYPPGKIATAPELPLTETGRSRLQRDVMQIFETFAAAVGTARGLSRDAIVALDADCLTGDAAVAAGLVDGVETLEQVQRYALAMASTENAMPMDPEAEKAPEEEAAEEEEETEEEAAARRAKAEEDEEEIPPSSKPATRRMSAPSSLASLAGVPEGSSDLAIRSSLAARVGVYAVAARVTGKSSPGEVGGALEALARDAGEVARMREQRDAAIRKANADERMRLLHRLSAMGTHSPGDLFRYEADAKGQRVIAGPAKLWGPGTDGRTLANLRGYVAACETRAPGAPSPNARRDPFQPKEAPASPSANGEPSPRAIEAAKQHPAVIAAFNRPNNTQTLEALARTHAAHFGGPR